jgi:hypothetical protein
MLRYMRDHAEDKKAAAPYCPRQWVNPAPIAPTVNLTTTHRRRQSLG